ncbi:MAG TPA: hypothetical protein VFX86_00490 [Candidatus Saccharimonadales bacterium]|nr:hypothetical protein [Candidatus Saccharimonadales bacterium]
MSKNKQSPVNLRKGLIVFSQLHFLFIILLIVQTILYDTSQLITPDYVLYRWVVISALLVVNSVIWYLAHSRSRHALMHKLLLLLMILADVALASFSVYTQRGMASRAVFLFIIPIIVSGLLLSRSALYATAILCIAAYSLSAISYFILNFNEGYKVELYGEVGFYSLSMLFIAGLLAKLLKSRE